MAARKKGVYDVVLMQRIAKRNEFDPSLLHELLIVIDKLVSSVLQFFLEHLKLKAEFFHRICQGMM